MKKPIVIEILIWFIILTAIFTVGMFAYSKVFVEPNIYNIEFKDIDGITKGSPVRFMGINIGYVRKLEAKDKHIQVQIVVTQRNMKIPNGTIARVEFYGLGGSKSIELMPADDNGQGAIVTTKTLRLHDMVMKAEDLVEILEIIEKLVKGINPPETHNMLEKISQIKDEKIKAVDNDFANFKLNIVEKVKTIKSKEVEVIEKIDNMNKAVERINKFIKK